MKLQKSTLLVIGGLFFSAALWYGCDKTTFNSKPALEFLGASSYDLRQGDLMSLRLRVIDKEGDITDSLFIRAATSRCPNNTVVLRYLMPQLPAKNNLDAEINIRFLIGVIGDFPIYNLNLCSGPDTVNFEFWIRDAAGNISDTIGTDRPIIIQN
jgi:hypothetical protein